MLKELISSGVLILSEVYPEIEAREIVFALLEDLLGTRRHTHVVNPSFMVSDKDSEKIKAAFMRLSSGEPLQYVTEKACFYGREFKVSPSVLIPRPETELLCRMAIEESMRRKDVRVLDMCTGSGCIAWTMALECPGAEVIGIDISDGALMVAEAQDFSEETSMTGALKPRFLKADVLAQPLTSMGKFDIILSNPPYVMESEKALMRRNVLDHEPHLALFVSDEDPLLFYRAVAKWALLMLKPGGYGMVEINEALASGTEKIFRDTGFRDISTIRDLYDRDRFVTFRYL